MTARTLVVLALALVFGVSAAVGVSQLQKQRMPELKPEMVQVVVATADIPRGVALSVDQVKIRDFPKDLAPAGAMTNLDDVVGRVLLMPLVEDEQVLESKLAAKGSGRGLAMLIPKGMRAFTIQTPNVATGVGGFVLPGNKVDVLLTVTGALGAESGVNSSTTTTLLENVEILAVDQRVDAPADNRVDPKEIRSVTLLTTPEQAAKLNLGQSKGTLHLTLRNPDDDQSTEPRSVTLADFSFRQENPEESPAPEVVKERPAEPAELTPPITKPSAAGAIHPLQIRTLRGTQTGVVHVYPLE